MKYINLVRSQKWYFFSTSNEGLYRTSSWKYSVIPFHGHQFFTLLFSDFFKRMKDALECGFHSIVIRQTWQKPEHMYLKNQKPYIIFQSLLQQIMSKNWYLLLQAGNKKVQWITKKHIPLVFQPFVYLVYLRTRLSYKKSNCIFLHPFLKRFQME